MRPRCYLAGPLGFTEPGRDYLRRVYLPALVGVVEPVDPWALTTADEILAARRDGRQRELALEIGRRNAAAIRSCTLLAALLDGQELDSGTAAEVGYGAALGLCCFGLRTDLRQHGEEGVAVNLQVEALIVDSGGEIVGSLAELVVALAATADRGSATGVQPTVAASDVTSRVEGEM
ncbi:MAG: nucleoside 2-deoxyribosyltransferase [Solirubrobacteraceae bacterium]